MTLNHLALMPLLRQGFASIDPLWFIFTVF
jgi:hypothetical protein